jgi:hypothetical protein
MPTINTILEELKNVPVEKLEDLYSIIHSLRTNIKKTDTKSQEILSYAGTFGDMSKSDYGDFVKHTKQTRSELFDRNINL